MDVVTLGMFIIDEIYHPPPRPADTNVMGGGGLYAALGARLFRPPPLSSKVGWIIHEGHDIPPELKRIIESWNTNCVFISTPDRPTTRARNTYGPGDHRAFEYINKKIRIDEACLSSTQLTSKVYHFICSAQRCIDLVNGIRRKRHSRASHLDTSAAEAALLMEEPVFIWEPVPDLCVPAEQDRTLEALTYVDVVSPNLEEFCSLFGIVADPSKESGRQVLKQKCAELVQGSFGCAVIVRLGEHGCLIVQPRETLIVPAYHRSPQDQNRVIDPTGGGNAFLGGFAVGYLQSPNRTRDQRFEEAVLYGNIAASFAIEQVGAPVLEESTLGRGETWNGELVEQRLEKYKARLLEQKLLSVHDP